MDPRDPVVSMGANTEITKEITEFSHFALL